MASLFSKVATFARSPQGQKVISQASTKAKDLANDPRTRAKIDQGTARVKAEVAKRRGGGQATTPPEESGTAEGPEGPVDPPVTPR